MIDKTVKNAVLGIDAAWTTREPSGVSLLLQTSSGWRSAGLAPSYGQFTALAEGKAIDWEQTPIGSEPNLEILVQAAQQLASPAEVRIVAVDMPVSHQRITGRRTADSKISKEYGGKGCAVHSPSVQRPGPLADKYRVKCHQLGFHLATASTPVGSQPSLIEVYPHTALLKLLNLDYRFPYKISRRNRYWKNETVQERKSNLIKSFCRILAALAKDIDGIFFEIPDVDDVISFASLKRYEDALDALVCAWVGKAYLERNCVPYGDEQAAIWVPMLNNLFPEG